MSVNFPALAAIRRPMSFLCIAVAAAPAWADDPPRLDPVVVTALREPQTADRVVADVVVIDAARIRDSGADSLEDLLRREGGIQLSRNGGPGQNAALLLRGGSAGNTVVLINGVRIGSATLGQTDFSSLSVAQIERIEILRGPASSLYGADAVGGVVRIVTRRGRGAPIATAYAAVGGLDSSAAEASVAGSGGMLDYAVGGAYESSAGVSAVREGDAFGLFNPDRDGFTRRSANLRAGLTVAPGHRLGLVVERSRIDAQFDSAEYPPPGFLPDPSPDFRRRDETAVTALDYRGEFASGWTTTLQLGDQRDETRSGASDQQRFDTLRRQYTWQQAWQPDADQQWIAAFERVEERIAATPYAAPQRGNNAVVVAWNGRSGGHRWQVDLRHDHNSAYGNVDTGKLGWAFAPAPDWTLRAVAGTAFRAPSFNDLYYPGYGVADVQPEESASIEATLEWRSGAAAAGATLYHNRVRDLIGYESDRSLCPSDPAYDFGCARNISRAVLQGATLHAEQRSGDFGLRLTLDFLDATDADTGERLARRAAHQETLAVDWTRGPWSAAATLLAVGARPDGGVQLAAYQTLDLQARWRFAPQWRVEAQLRNAFDRDIEPARDYRAPGRQGWIGVRYDGAGF
jgi:vitamin B12 transporter